MKPPVTISRVDLYELVWTVPMVTLARRFGLSDNGLKKKCEKHMIPRPKMGHWTKIECGHRVPREPLPEIDDKSLEVVQFCDKPKPIAQSDEIPVEEYTSPAIAKALDFRFPKRINNYHSLVRKYREQAKGRYKDRYGHVSFGQERQGISVRITTGSIERVSILLHSLLVLFEDIGWKLASFESHHYHKDCHAIRHEGEELHIRIKEIVKQYPHVKTDKEKKDKYYYGPTYDYQPTGILELSVDNIYRTDFTTKWKDSKKSGKLEDQIVPIIQGLDRAFRHKKQKSIEAEIARKEREREEARKREAQRLLDIENKQRELLFKLVDNQKKATALRDFVALFEEWKYPEGFSLWLDWVGSVADSIDPIKNPESILLDHHQIATSPKWSW